MDRPIHMVCEDYDGKALIGADGGGKILSILPEGTTQEERRQAIMSHAYARTGRSDLRFCWVTREEWEQFYHGLDLEAIRALS